MLIPESYGAALARGKRTTPSRTACMAIVTLLTDFGTADYFVAAMKGAVLSVAPAATLVDVTHEIAPQDVAAAAFTLAAAYPAFPAGSVHVAVVDPGVGSARRAIVVGPGSPQDR